MHLNQAAMKLAKTSSILGKVLASSKNLPLRANLHSWGNIVDYEKLRIHSNTSFSVAYSVGSNLRSIVNQERVFKKQKSGTSLKKSAARTNCITLSIINKNGAENNRHSLSTSLRKFCTCPPKNPCPCPPPPQCSSAKSCQPGRDGYHEETEDAINQQILAELDACYAYLAMACYFGRTEVALPGCHGFFMFMHHEEHQHALFFINYQIMRGGHVKLFPLAAPAHQDCNSITSALAVAVEMEKCVKQKLLILHQVAEKHCDFSVIDVVSVKFIDEQERSIRELARLLVRATNMGPSGAAEYLFDKELHKAFVKKPPKIEESPIETTYK